MRVINAEGVPIMRIAWLGTTTDCASSDSRYYCEWLRGLRDSPEIDLVQAHLDQNVSDWRGSANKPVEADAILFPHWCTVNLRTFPRCFAYLRPADPPVLVMFNKVFEGFSMKTALVRKYREQTALLLVPTPLVKSYEIASGVRTIFMPYGVNPATFGRYASDTTLAYTADLGFTGGWQRYDDRYLWRHALLGNKTMRAGLEQRGVRLFTPNGLMPTDTYVRVIAQSKLWFATTELGAHASTRFYEVLASGRSLLLCNRDLAAYDPLGLKDGVHAAMFNTTEEFESKLAYYLAHEEKRMAVVRAAREFVVTKHTWAHRASGFAAAARSALAGPSRPSPRVGAAGASVAPSVANASRPRIAVCLVGFVRTLSEPRVFHSLARALRWEDASVDFFGVVSLGGDEVDTAKGQWGQVSHESLAPALEALAPTRWEEHMPLSPEAPCGLDCLRQFQRFEHCVGVAKEQERKNGAKYDWIVKTRPDLSFSSKGGGSFARMKLQPTTLYKDRTAADLVVLIPRAHAENISSLLASQVL